MIYAIAQHEIVKLFKTGKIWKLLALCQFILGLIFYWLMEEFLFKTKNLLLENKQSFGITEEVVHPLFAWTALLFFFITPLLATNSLSQERKSHTLNLYFISGAPSINIIFGKFIGLFLAEIFLLLPIFLMPLLITIYDHLDLGQFTTGLLGLVFLLSATLSLGIFISSLSKEPLIAALLIFFTILFISLLEWIARFLSPNFNWFTELSLLHHCKNFLSGAVNTQDIIYFCLFSFIFLYLGAVRLDKEPYFKQNL